MNRKPVLLLPLLLAFLLLPASGTSAEQALNLQEETLEIEKLERAAEKAGGIAEYGATLDEGLAVLLETGRKSAGGIVKEALRSGILLLTIIMFCAFADTVYETAGRNGVPIISLTGTLAIAAVSISDVDSMLGLGRSTMERIADFSNVLLPAVAAITAATGAVTGAAVRQMAAVLFSDLLVNLINSLLIPLLYAYLTVSVAQAALGNEGLKRMGGLLKWTVTTVLTGVMVTFVGYLTVSGVVAGSADAMAVKTAKFAISGAIPVVGGILSDAAETILTSAGVLKGTVGVFGAVTILSLCLLPLLRIAVHYLMYKLVAAVSGAVGPPRICALVEQIGGAFGLMLGMTGACGLLMLVALVSSITAVST